jgi:hypothetical protein
MYFLEVFCNGVIKYELNQIISILLSQATSTDSLWVLIKRNQRPFLFPPWDLRRLTCASNSFRIEFFVRTPRPFCLDSIIEVGGLNTHSCTARQNKMLKLLGMSNERGMWYGENTVAGKLSLEGGKKQDVVTATPAPYRLISR